MKNELKSISANNDLDFYYNPENFGNQDLLFSIIDYFETGARKGFFEPLEFMNLLWEQYNFVVANVSKAHSTITALKALPLKPLQKHVLFGFILKMFGGYPVENGNKQFDSTLRLIEKEFLCYEGATPEKKYCQRNWAQHSRIKQIETFMNNSINGRDTDSEYDFVKVKEFLKTMPETHIQIAFLSELKTEYLQNKTGMEFDFGTPFDQQCELEIIKLEKIHKLEQSTQAKPQFQLSKRAGAKTDLIRVLNALWELKFFEMNDGQIPSKKNFMKLTGDFFGTDLSSYQSSLSQSFKEQPLEVNLKIFDEMKNSIQKAHIDNK